MRNKRKYIRTTGIILLFCVALLNTACVSKQKEKVVLELKQGLLSLIPLNQNAVRVQFSQPGSAPMEELIYTEKLPVPEYEVTEDKQSLVLSLDGISVEFDKGTEVLTFKDANKRIILQEKVGGRFMKVSSVQNEPTYQVEQRFVSPIHIWYRAVSGWLSKYPGVDTALDAGEYTDFYSFYSFK